MQMLLPHVDAPLCDGRIAIIDIGSNSIRLVVYDQQKRSPVSIYNEKVMCGLGKGLANTGRLNPDALEEARRALARFLALGRNMQIRSLHIMATAAVRDAEDGAEFVRELEQEHGIKIDVISGEKEARLGAYGVCSSMHRPCGLIGDLGGGSLEMVEVADGRIGDHTSLALGSLRMLDETKGNRQKMRTLIARRCAELDWMEGRSFPVFYAIGGSFRALAKMYMAAQKYPLHILHEFTVDAALFQPFVQEIADLSPEKLEKYPGSAAKRVPQLPGAAMLLDRIITLTSCDRIVFSASGIREGYVYELLPPELRARDGLLSSCTEFASRGGRNIAYAGDLYAWMTPLLHTEDETEARLRMAFCLISDLALHIHPEYRADWAFERMIFSAMTCLTHQERVKLALALYYRYQYKQPMVRPELKLISEADRRWSRMLGVAANLAYHLSGSIAGNLDHLPLRVTSSDISLSVIPPQREGLMGDAVARRLQILDDFHKLYLKK